MPGKIEVRFLGGDDGILWVNFKPMHNLEEDRMNNIVVKDLGLNLAELRHAIQEEYAAVALQPEQGFHFHTGRPLARLLGYAEEWLTGIPEASIESLPALATPLAWVNPSPVSGW